MLEAEHYKEKIVSMQKYVCLLSKLIAQLQEKNDATAESIEKIRQLKILQQQLCDPKPGILLEELNKCEQVLESLFILYENKSNSEIPQGSLIKENRQDEDEEIHIPALYNIQQKKEFCSSELKANKKFLVDVVRANLGDEISEKIKENLQNTEQRMETLKNYTKNIKSALELKPITALKSKKDRLNKFESTSNAENATLNSGNSQIIINNCTEKGKTETLELCFNSNEDAEENEFIGPDKQTLFFKRINENNDKNKQICKAFHLPFSNIQNEKNTNCLNKPNEKNNNDTSKDNEQNLPQPIITKKLNKTNNIDFITKINVCSPETVPRKKERLIPLEKNKKSNRIIQKRSTNTSIDSSKAKKQKVLHSITSRKKLDRSIYPLAIDPESTKFSSESYCNGHNNYEDSDNVEITESRNSPILVDSDEDVKNLETEVLKPKRQPFAFKSNNKNNIFDTNYTEKDLKNQKPLFTEKLILTRKSERRVMPIQQTNFLSNMDLQPNSLKSKYKHLFNTSFGQKALLMPNAVDGSRSDKNQDPKSHLMKEQVNFSYANNDSSDAAHCRWLNNFLHHFCSPRNIVHSFSYLLLQRALRQDDYERIRRSRTEMSSTEIDINARLIVCQLRNICYADGNHKMQKLTFVGRKLCQLAFFNILDKTIALTTDSVTNDVTARTRISPEIPEAIRTEMSEPKNSAVEIKSIEKNLHIQDSEAVTCSKTFTSQNSSYPRKRREDDTEYCPPCIISPSFINIPPRRSLRNISRPQSTSKYSATIAYTENTEAAHEYALNEIIQQFPKKREKCSVTDATEAYIAKKRLAAEQERQKKAISFENAFIETISQQIDSQSSKQFKDSLNSISNFVSSNESRNNGSDIFIISDDDNDLEEIPIEEHERSRFYVIPKTYAINCKSFATTPNIPVNKKYKNQEKRANIKKDTEVSRSISSDYVPKNISPAVHSESKFRFNCLICSQPITHAVSHYVNNHPEHEVFLSRPTPRVAQDMLNNKLDPAMFDRLQMSRNLYITTCVFCQKKASFTLLNWYQHFASHTGEYAFKCTGCDIRKSTRSQLVSHIQNQCIQNGDIEVIQEYDLDLLKISAYTCKLCNFTQLNFTNVLNHLKYQHDMPHPSEHNISKVTLLEKPKSVSNRIQSNIRASETQSNRFYVHGGDNYVFEIVEIDDADDITDS